MTNLRNFQAAVLFATAVFFISTGRNNLTVNARRLDRSIQLKPLPSSDNVNYKSAFGIEYSDNPDPREMLIDPKTNGLRLAPKEKEGTGEDPKTPEDIYGGNNADFGRYPWFASLYHQFCELNVLGSWDCYDYLVTTGCGATLIAEDFILTAGHCILGGNPMADPTYPGAIVIEVGAFCMYNNLDVNCGQESEIHFIKGFALHPFYQNLLPIASLYDVGLYGLKNMSSTLPVKLNDGSNPNLLTKDKELTALGFGRTDPDDPDSSPSFLLQEGTLLYDATNYCDNAQTSSVFFCAGSSQQHACQGDSGGPLFVKGSSSTLDVQVGITSFGPTNGPGYFTDVGNLFPWISTIVCENSEGDLPIWCSSTTEPTTTEAPSTEAPTELDSYVNCSDDNPDDAFAYFTMATATCDYLDTPEKIEMYCNSPLLSNAAQVCKSRCGTCATTNK